MVSLETSPFIPRAFSITHVNLTHRNWTAIGVPDRDFLPIVDPRGLVTPLWDGWSLDGWIRNMFVREEGERLVVASGILPEWLEEEGSVSLGPAPTSFGEGRVEIVRRGRRAEVRWGGSWREAPLGVEVRLPGFKAVDVPAGQRSALLEPEAGP